MRNTLLTQLLALAALVFATGCDRDRVFDVTGVIRGELDQDQLVIEHADIPGFMPAMTMAFNVADPAEAAQLRSGDQVQFRFRVGETRSVAEAFRVTGQSAAVDAPAPPPIPRSRLRVGDVVPAFALMNEAAQPFTEDLWRDRFTVVTFIFTRCPVPEFCPALALRFRELQAAIKADPELRERARLLSVTLDPEFDRPEILRAYGEAVGADPAVWQFATGETAEVEAVARAFAVYTERNGITLDHTLTTALIGPNGEIIELWRGNGWRSDEVVAAMQTAN